MGTNPPIDDGLEARRQAATSPCHRNGVPVLPWKPEGASVDLALVNSLRDEPIPT